MEGHHSQTPLPVWLMKIKAASGPFLFAKGEKQVKL